MVLGSGPTGRFPLGFEDEMLPRDCFWMVMLGYDFDGESKVCCVQRNAAIQKGYEEGKQ